MVYFLHLDKVLDASVSHYGTFIYLLIFGIIFFETGIVVTPFLPGDSLLFAAGAIAASSGSLNIWLLFLLISIAAILGDTVNYHLGKYFGFRAFNGNYKNIFKKEYLDKTEVFYLRHGEKAIVLGRFFPIIRTFIPFVAGIGKMDYSKFIFYNILGGGMWTLVCLASGYLFGNIQLVKNNFSLVIFGIILISLIPGIYQIIKKEHSQKDPTL